MSPLTTDILLIVLGFLPSLIWLGIFLQKDSHPEPRYLLIRVFLMGMILSPVAVGLQWGFVGLGEKFSPAIFSFASAHFFLWAALVEELVKGNILPERIIDSNASSFSRSLVVRELKNIKDELDAEPERTEMPRGSRHAR